MNPSPETKTKLEENKIIWVATVRPEGRPHLVPVWFVWEDPKIFLSIDPASVKSHNIAANPWMALALEDGTHPVICEGQAFPVSPPLPEEITRRFLSKYDWDILTEKQYNLLVEIHPKKWLVW
jgi:hypothetical protein